MITSKQVKDIQFQRSGMNGYKAVEVDGFIDEVSETLSFMESKVSQLEQMIEKNKQDSSIIQDTLIQAQRLAAEIKDNAQAEAEKIVADANNSVANVVEDAKAEADRMITEAKNEAISVKASADESYQEALKKAEYDAKLMIEEAKEKARNIITEATADANEISQTNKAEVKKQQSILDAVTKVTADCKQAVIQQLSSAIEVLTNEIEKSDFDMEEAAQTVESSADVIAQNDADAQQLNETKFAAEEIEEPEAEEQPEDEEQPEVVFEMPAEEVKPDEEMAKNVVFTFKVDDEPKAEADEAEQLQIEVEPEETVEPDVQYPEEDEQQETEQYEEPAKGGFRVVFDDEDDDAAEGRFTFGESDK